jgi:hypothetical protein
VYCSRVDPLTLFGLGSLTACLLCYALERRSSWFGLGFAISCALSSVYGFLLRGAWPFGIIEAVWTVIALRRWWLERARLGPASRVAPN